MMRLRRNKVALTILMADAPERVDFLSGAIHLRPFSSHTQHAGVAL
jgi:hypothetical protein